MVTVAVELELEAAPAVTAAAVRLMLMVAFLELRPMTLKMPPVILLTVAEETLAVLERRFS